MTILQLSTPGILAWLLSATFFGTGLFNAAGGAAVRAQFLRWGYPPWWNFVAAAFDGLSGALIFFPETRIEGLAFGAILMIAAIAIVVTRRDYQHVPPAIALVALTGIELALVDVH